jgi:hypothetical protein
VDVTVTGGIAAKLARHLTSADGTAATRLRAAYLGKGRSVEAYRACPLHVVAVEGDRLALEGVWRFFCAQRRVQLPACAT